MSNSPVVNSALAHVLRRANAPRGGREVHILHAAREEPDLLPPLLEGVEPSEVSYSAGNGDTALIVLSAKHDRPDLVRALHAAGAELDAINHEEMTALMSAAWNGHRGNVLELLVLGADLGDHGAEHGYRAADWAREKGHHEIAELINDPRKAALEARLDYAIMRADQLGLATLLRPIRAAALREREARVIIAAVAFCERHDISSLHELLENPLLLKNFVRALGLSGPSEARLRAAIAEEARYSWFPRAPPSASPGKQLSPSSRAAQLLATAAAPSPGRSPAGAALVPIALSSPARRPWYDASPLAGRS